MIRTAEQDQELTDLYEQRETVQDYGIEHKVDVSMAISRLDADIWMLTEFLDPVTDMLDDLKGAERTAFEILMRVGDDWTESERAAAISSASFLLECSVSEVDPLATVGDWAADPNEKRAHEWKQFLGRMNAPEMVERRGAILTPYGWRNDGVLADECGDSEFDWGYEG